MTETDSMAKRFAIVACAYATYALQRFVPLPSVSAYFAVPYVVGLVCAPVAVVAMVPVLWTGPTWAKIIGGLLALPPIYVLITMVRSLFGEVTYFNLMI